MSNLFEHLEQRIAALETFANIISKELMEGTIKEKSNNQSFKHNQKKTMDYQQGDLVWVNFPFTDDFTKAKKRPAIVISNALSNGLGNDLLLVPISSRLHNDTFSFLIEDSDLSVPLPRKSEARCNKVITIRRGLVIRKLDELKVEALQRLIEKVIAAIMVDNLPKE